MGKNGIAIDRKQLAEFYEQMILIRRFEYSLIDCFKKGYVLGNMHTYIGEEAIAVGVIGALKKTDLVSSTHRCNGHLIAKGADLNAMMAEMMGKEEGLCGGRAGKMHQCAPEVGVLSANGIVGAAVLLGAGHALYSKLYQPDQVTAAFFGDGAANQGMFHEGINMAALWDLPVVFVCENNQYAISTNVRESTSSETIAQRAKSYDIPGVLVDGNDVVAVYEAAAEAVARAREGKGPTLIECYTYRVRGHHEGDPQEYRSKEVTEDWVENRCAVKRAKELLVAEYGWTEQEDEAVCQRVEERIRQAIEFGIAGTPMRLDDMEKHVYCEEGEHR